MNSAQHFDLARFLELIDNDLELYQSLLEVFKSDWPNVIGQLKAALEKHSSVDIEKLGHRLKGNLRNFYAEDLAAEALKIEEMGKESQFQGLAEKVSELEIKISQLEGQLDEKLTDLKAQQG